jgi:hypothetical protein
MVRARRHCRLSRALGTTHADSVACLKLSDGDLARLKKYVEAATTDYRDVLAWAEYPRQMRLGPNAPPADQAHARREDMDEYAQWLRSSQK